jgi:hypothetical protein
MPGSFPICGVNHVAQGHAKRVPDRVNGRKSLRLKEKMAKARESAQGWKRQKLPRLSPRPNGSLTMLGEDRARDGAGRFKVCLSFGFRMPS